MRSVRGFWFLTWVLLACGVQADTIPTLVAASGSAGWGLGHIGRVSGPDFSLEVEYPEPPGRDPCAAPVPAGDCIAPGPALFFQYPGFPCGRKCDARRHH